MANVVTCRHGGVGRKVLQVSLHYWDWLRGGRGNVDAERWLAVGKHLASRGNYWQRLELRRVHNRHNLVLLFNHNLVLYLGRWSAIGLQRARPSLRSLLLGRRRGMPSSARLVAVLAAFTNAIVAALQAHTEAFTILFQTFRALAPTSAHRLDGPFRRCHSLIVDRQVGALERLHRKHIASGQSKIEAAKKCTGVLPTKWEHVRGGIVW